MSKILLATAKKRVRERLKEYFSKAEYEMVEAGDSKEAKELFCSVKPSLVLVDATLDATTGISLCEEIRESSDVPIILIVNKHQRELGVEGIEKGNDDFLVRPLKERETLARLQAVLRRSPDREPVITKLSYTNLNIDMERQRVIAFGRELCLAAKERELLFFLASHPNIAFSREQLLEHVWRKSAREDMRTIDTHIKKLRQRLNAPPNYIWGIGTVWSVGYKFYTEEEITIL